MQNAGGGQFIIHVHVVSSSHTDTYAAFAAAIGALKGPLHGAANANVMDMMANIKENVEDWTDENEVAAYIEKILRKKAHNRTGLVYGIGHAGYTKIGFACSSFEAKGEAAGQSEKKAGAV